MVRAINSRLPDDLEVRGAEVVDASFDAIRDATDKQYRYRIFDAPYRPLGLRNVVYQHPMRPSFDVDRMNDAARRLVGTHDVEGFCGGGSRAGDDGADGARLLRGRTPDPRGVGRRLAPRAASFTW